MILFVDTEPYGRGKPEALAPIQAARTRLTYMLEDLAEQPVHLVRYNKLDRDLLATLQPSVAFLSGNTVAPDAYGNETATLFDFIREAPCPTFGFCGGHQLIAMAHGIDPTRVVADGEPATESGQHRLHIVADHPLTQGLEHASEMRHHHSWQVPRLPDGFVNLASTDLCELQLIVDDDRRVVGSQFHPEYWTKKHPAGRRLLKNFLDW